MTDDASPKYQSEIRLRDPLSEVTRKERRTLLGVSLVGVMTAETGLLPTEISVLGINFDVPDQQALLFVLAGVVIYFSVAFLLYAASDVLAWRLALRRSMSAWAIRVKKQTEQERLAEFDAYKEAGLLRILYSRSVSHALIKPISILRAAFEFVVPLLFAAYAVSVVLVLAASLAQKPPCPSLQPTASGKPATAAKLTR